MEIVKSCCGWRLFSFGQLATERPVEENVRRAKPGSYRFKRASLDDVSWSQRKAGLFVPPVSWQSFAMRFPDEIGDLAFPLFPFKEILQWDAIRATSDFPEAMFKNWG